METTTAPGIAGRGTLGTIDPSGMWEWTGRLWISTLSPDGTARWNGKRWVERPNSPALVALATIAIALFYAVVIVGITMVVMATTHLVISADGPVAGHLTGLGIIVAIFGFLL